MENQLPKVESISKAEHETHNRLEQDARLAAQGKCMCRKCKRVFSQNVMLMVVANNTIMLAVCHECMREPIVIEREGSYLKVGFLQPREQPNVVCVPSMPSNKTLNKLQHVVPDVKKVQL